MITIALLSCLIQNQPKLATTVIYIDNPKSSSARVAAPKLIRARAVIDLSSKKAYLKTEASVPLGSRTVSSGLPYLSWSDSHFALQFPDKIEFWSIVPLMKRSSWVVPRSSVVSNVGWNLLGTRAHFYVFPRLKSGKPGGTGTRFEFAAATPQIKKTGVQKLPTYGVVAGTSWYPGFVQGKAQSYCVHEFEQYTQEESPARTFHTTIIKVISKQNTFRIEYDASVESVVPTAIKGTFVHWVPNNAEWIAFVDCRVQDIKEIKLSGPPRQLSGLFMPLPWRVVP